MKDVKQWVEQSPYGASLGVELESLDDTGATLHLPYKDENSNPGQALHGGCAASLGIIGGQAVARHALGAAAAPWHTANLQVSYLSASIGQDVRAQARLLRRGKELCFVNTSIETPEGKPIAHVTSVIRGRFGADLPERNASQGDHGEAEPGPLGAGFGKLPFIAGRAITVEHMARSRARLSMPAVAQNRDLDGTSHEGAVLALLDTAGASAAWAESGVGPYKASTAAIQAQLLTATPAADLVAYGRCYQRDAEIFFADVEIAERDTQRISARGTVLYRIVT